MRDSRSGAVNNTTNNDGAHDAQHPALTLHQGLCEIHPTSNATQHVPPDLIARTSYHGTYVPVKEVKRKQEARGMNKK
jgi:hypothetical protein